MNKRDRLIGQVFSLVVLWYATSLPGLAADPGPGGNGSSPSGSTGLQLLNRGSGTRFASYAAQVQARIKEALLQNNKTNTALIVGVLVRIWVDSMGRVTRVQLPVSTANPLLDRAITNEVLTGLQLKEPPPSNMPMPIVVRVTTHRPS